MKVLIVYASESHIEVENIRDIIGKKFGESTNLRIDFRDRRKGNWHKDARVMIEQANIVVYAVSSNSHLSKNVEWELKQAVKKDKYIVCLPLEDVDLKSEGIINSVLHKTDKETKEKQPYAKILGKKEELFDIISDYNNCEYLELFNSEEVKKDEDKKILMDQYKLFSDTAETLLTRRQNMNSFYISANTALIMIGATIFAISDIKDISVKFFILLALSVPGILLNRSWTRTLKSYSVINKGKMKVLNMIESKLPARLYDAEWKGMKNQYNKNDYVSFYDSEKKLPWIFIAFFIIVDVLSVILLITNMI